MKILEKINIYYEFEFLTNESMLNELWSKTDYKLIIEKINSDPKVKTVSGLNSSSGIKNKFKEKLNKLLILSYKTAYDGSGATKSKTVKSGYETIMHLAGTIYKNIDQVKSPEQIKQIIKHIEIGRDRYIEVAKAYQQFRNSLQDLADETFDDPQDIIPTHRELEPVKDVKDVQDIIPTHRELEPAN